MRFKIILKAFLLVAIFVIFTKEAFANNDFQTDVKVEYKVETSGVTQVVNEISITNKKSESYATDFILNLDNIDPINPRALDGGKRLKLKHIKKGEDSYLLVNFDEAIVGIGNNRSFTVIYEENSFAQRTGEVWEIVTPKLSEENSFKKYEVILSVPMSFGKEAYLSPEPTGKNEIDGIRLYNFDKKLVERSGITAGFGEFQVYSFNLKYHLENPLRKIAPTKIALPPDTSIQKVYYTLIDPKPDEIEVDEDGNWLAVYNLKSRQRLDVSASGSVKILASPRKLSKLSARQFFDYTSATKYWQADNEQIKSIANKLDTPKSVYDFVVDNLAYDYDRVRPNVERLGAKQAINLPNNAICTEFTDLFIALARASGIPAREIHGFAYTENPEIQPLSLVSDVLHSWPEYWSIDQERWVPIDPTWAKTSGIDFFNKLDLRHFAFVIHGIDDTQPYAPGSYKLGPNPQKDVFVSFGQLPENKKPEVEITSKFIGGMSVFSKNVMVDITNKSSFALYDVGVDLFFDDNHIKSDTDDIVPPYGSYQMQFVVPIGLLGKDTPRNVYIKTDYSEYNLPGFESQAVILQLVIISTLFTVLIIIVFVKTGKIDFGKLYRKMRSKIENEKAKISPRRKIKKS
jgi:hypothetical protein